MLNIAVCDDSRTDVEMLESAFDKLAPASAAASEIM